MRLSNLALAATIVMLPSLAIAQGAHSGHPTPAHRARTPDMPATQGYRQANQTMHKNMDIAFSGNADIDFVRGMIPHHQGAIDMAKVALQHAKDEKVRQWAQDVIREQEREIAEMQAWLKSKGVQ